MSDQWRCLVQRHHSCINLGGSGDSASRPRNPELGLLRALSALSLTASASCSSPQT